MKRIISLVFLMSITLANISYAEPVPIHDIVGASGMLDKCNNLTFNSKSIYFTSCNKIPGTPEETYLIETNAGDLGDNVLLIYPNEQGTINKIIILLREDGRFMQDTSKILTEEILTIFNSFIIPPSNEEENKNLIGAFVQAGKTGKSSFWSRVQGRRYIIERFRTINNNIRYSNVRITARI